MVTFLIQKKLIKFGLRDKSFLYKTKVVNNQTNKSQDSFNNERRCLVPEDEKKLKEVKNLHKRMQELLKESNFIEAVGLLKQILQLKEANWQEISCIWNYAIHNRDITMARTI